tara:strand:- start:243 stop:476 length:234 start_codon:yes stop_codon:yes gene_type:complete
MVKEHKYERKYDYPTDYICKRGTLKKNRPKQIYNWRKNIKNKKVNDVLLENYDLKKSIKSYQIVLEEWVLYAQNIYG